MNAFALGGLPFLFAFILSCAITYLTILVYRGLGIVDKSTRTDHPKNVHTEPVPRGGGIPIYASMFFVTAMFLQFDPHVAAILGGGLILVVLGVLDDLFNLSPYLRLGMGVVAASVVVISGIGISYISNPLGGVINFEGYQIAFEFLGQLRTFNLIADTLAVLWITWAMNFVNMGAKGLDGQLPGVVVIAGVVMGILSFRFANDITAWPSAYLSFALAGAYAGLLVFNFYPQKIMPGWGGGSLAGYFLSVLSILSGAKVATALIVLGVPLMDVIYAVIRRVMAGKSPVWGDDQHLHHRLLKLGWSKKQVAGFYWLVTAVLGIAALQLNSQLKIYTIVLTAVGVGGLLLWVNLFLSYGRRG
ncbi:MAG: UDP-N-acetylmuramyl pentapeptide phosphotransferase/UDP-N-acetylglucosamine-1-phosphate transferase [Microgenomates group bacterium GW2011_GWF2_47_9]|nr:MAG: UDP-N-acetylmuramyl pentapeptide phosphotransferase/UDP-N-acetylglucosamine-1-phosphate transferase [Microgenomates group bacterium GW2011_GWF2_47_9]